MSPDDGSREGAAPGGEAPAGWEAAKRGEGVRSWLGGEERVVCTREATDEDGWIAFAQPRGELGTSNQVPLTESATGREAAVEAARDYMERHGDAG